MNPLISCIVPVYNKENTVRKCVNSLIEQTYKDIEIILIDDGSTDASGSICEKYAEEYDNIILLSHSNKGVSYTRNVGIEISKGDYITFIDADDYLSEVFLERLISFFDRKTDIVVCSCNVVTDTEVIPQHFYSESFDTRKDPEAIKKIFFQLMDTNYGQRKPVYTGVGVPWGKLIRRNSIEEPRIRFNQELCHYEDNLFVLELLLNKRSFVYQDECLYYYSAEHISNVLINYNQKVVDSYLRLFQYRRKVITEHKQVVNQQMYSAFLNASLDLFDIAVFSMIIEMNEFSFNDTVRQVECGVENTGYNEILLRIGISTGLMNLTIKRRILYLMLGLRCYWMVVLLFRLRRLV